MEPSAPLTSQPKADSTDKHPRTPPYTPLRRRIGRSASPASVRSLHPFETVSPAKKTENDTKANDGLRVVELKEGDAEYPMETGLVYPEELEEPKSAQQSDTSTDEDADNEAEDDGASEDEIADHFSRLDCDDDQVLSMRQRRRAKRARLRANSRLFKRTHSQSMQGDVDMSDPDAMADQDRSSSARRLRRRVQGPSDVKVMYDDAPRTPPPSRGHAATGELETWVQHSAATGAEAPTLGNDMDVDDDSHEDGIA